MSVDQLQQPGGIAEVVQLDDSNRAYAVTSDAGEESPSWVVFIGERAGPRAYAYADAHFADVKTGRRMPPPLAREILAFAS